MAQAYIKVQVLILLATALVISCSNYKMVSEVFVVSGSVAVLPCVMSTSNEHSSAVTWKRISGGEERTFWRRDRSGLSFRPAGQAQRAHCPQPNFGNADYSLHIEGTREEDAGMYRCEVEGQNIKNVMLRVGTVSFTPAEVLEGDRLTLTCSVTPQPTTVLTKWELNGSSMTGHTYSQTLARNNVSQKDAGTWRCLIRHKQTELKASAFLQVKGILVPRDNYEVVYAELGSSITLPCIFSNGFVFNSSSWKKVSKTTHLPASLPSFFKNSSGPGVSRCSSVQYDRSAYIESVQEGDEGTYRCSGQVEGANSRRVIVERNIQLVTAQVLSAPRNGRMALTCHISNGSQITDYEWIHVNYGVNDTLTFTPVQKSKSKVLNIPKEAKHLGEWVCRYYDGQRLLGNVTYHLQMMSGLEGQEKSGSGNKAAMIIGLGFLLVVLVLIVLQLYKNHRRRKMIMQYPAMETIVHIAANEREIRERINTREKSQNAACGEDPKSMCV